MSKEMVCDMRKAESTVTENATAVPPPAGVTAIAVLAPSCTTAHWLQLVNPPSEPKASRVDTVADPVPLDPVEPVDPLELEPLAPSSRTAPRSNWKFCVP